MGESDLETFCYDSWHALAKNDIGDFGNSDDLLKCMIESFLKSGKIREALNTYINAFNRNFLDFSCFNVFIDGLIDTARKNLEKSVFFNKNYFLCTFCNNVITDPVTLKCGHTFSKQCILSAMKKESFSCENCNKTFTRNYISQLKVNITISAIIEKLQRNKFGELKNKLNAAPAPFCDSKTAAHFNDTVLVTETYSSPSKFSLGRKESLVNLMKYEDVLTPYLIYYTFNPNAFEVKEQAIKILHNFIKKYCIRLHRLLFEYSLSLRSSSYLKKKDYFIKKVKYSENISTVKHPMDCDNGFAKSLSENQIEVLHHLHFNGFSEGKKLSYILDSFCKKLEQFAGDTFIDKKYVSSLDKRDFECSLCMRIFWEPITTHCGHTFCRVCLYRCFDHQPTCPLCKTSLANILAERLQKVDDVLQLTIKSFLPEEYADREAMYKKEMEEFFNAGKDVEHVIPLFVCTTAYPTVPCPLHVFEPRYRLMIRQCIESGSKRFGMCAVIDNEIVEYGTMLEIRDVRYFEDGRSVVDTVGSRRFRILKKSERDGYTTGAVEFLQDEAVCDIDKQYVKGLHDQVYQTSENWFKRLQPSTRYQILQHFGSMPEMESNYCSSVDGPSWFWWMLAILPVEPKSQQLILSMTSLPNRLKTLYKILLHLDSVSMA